MDDKEYVLLVDFQNDVLIPKGTRLRFDERSGTYRPIDDQYSNREFDKTITENNPLFFKPVED